MAENVKYMTSFFILTHIGRCHPFSLLRNKNYVIIIIFSMGASNENFMGMLRETAIDAIRKSWNIVLDKKFEILKDKQYFGKIESTILRSKVCSLQSLRNAIT